MASVRVSACVDRCLGGVEFEAHQFPAVTVT
jgi:hypothetical protein